MGVGGVGSGGVGWGVKIQNKLGSVKILPLCAEGSGSLASRRPTCAPKPPRHVFSQLKEKKKKVSCRLFTFLATSCGNLTHVGDAVVRGLTPDPWLANQSPPSPWAKEICLTVFFSTERRGESVCFLPPGPCVGLPAQRFVLNGGGRPSRKERKKKSARRHCLCGGRAMD